MSTEKGIFPPGRAFQYWLKIFYKSHFVKENYKKPYGRKNLAFETRNISEDLKTGDLITGTDTFLLTKIWNYKKMATRLLKRRKRKGSKLAILMCSWNKFTGGLSFSLHHTRNSPNSVIILLLRRLISFCIGLCTIRNICFFSRKPVGDRQIKRLLSELNQIPRKKAGGHTRATPK